METLGFTPLRIDTKLERSVSPKASEEPIIDDGETTQPIEVPYFGGSTVADEIELPGAPGRLVSPLSRLVHQRPDRRYGSLTAGGSGQADGSSVPSLTESLSSSEDGAPFAHLKPGHESAAISPSGSLDIPSTPWHRAHSFGPAHSSAYDLRPLRRRQRRATSTTSKSPAQAFLSMWNREPPPPQPDDEGQIVGNDYVIGKQIGYGGFSTVKEAFRVGDDGRSEAFAVKIVRKLVGDKNERDNEQLQTDFDHEVRLWRYLSHPHILALNAVIETNYATFCFTPLASRGSLFDLMRQNRQGLGLRCARQYAFQLADALRYLHEDARIVHNDVKLENCLLTADSYGDEPDVATLVIADFGLAEWISSDSDSPTPYDNKARRCVGIGYGGSLEYAAPELLQSPSSTDGPPLHPPTASDIWAFGVVAYSLFVGARPFHDAFAPRLQTSIVTGAWDREAVLQASDGSGKEGGEVDSDKQGELGYSNLQNSRQDALALVRGCLELDPMKRPAIADVLACPFFDGCSADDTISVDAHVQWY